ncbi:MAG: carboxypeptidase-like regulatory domain-containing protein [Kofleriaceae bacterium]
MSFKSSWLVAAMLGLAALTPATPAFAQIAGALGHPLPAADLPTGTVSVKVIAGKISEPVSNVEVTLIVNGTPREARTDSAGRAMFPNLPAGAKIQAKVQDEDNKDIESDEFALAADSGQRLLLSTKPFVPMGGPGGAPFAGTAAGGGMPEPRQLSGEPRPEATDQPGSFTVRLTYDDLEDKTPPVGVSVFLVGYNADDSIQVFEAKSDSNGRATFTKLDRSGATSYFAMAQLVRGEGAEQKVDRLVSTAAVLDTRSGVRLILSSAKRDSNAPAIDDLVKLGKQDNAPAEPGKLHVTMAGVPEEGASIELLALKAGGGKRTVAKTLATRAPPNPQDIQGQNGFTPKPDMPPHTVRVQVHGGGLDENNPIGGISVRLVPAAAATQGDLSGIGTEQKTPDTGFYDVTDSTKGPLIAAIMINGKEMQSQPFDLAASGGVLDIEAHWDKKGKLGADFDVSGVQPDEVLVAQTTMFSSKTLFRTPPFQPVASHGTEAALLIYPRVLFEFSLTSRIDDEFLAVGGKFEVTNYSWAPYIGGTDGMIIPLPAHFKGARVGEQDQDDVAVAAGEGFRIGRAIPPGGKTFHGQFSLPVDGGNVDWALDLPIGAFQSGLEILQTPGMSVVVPPGVKGETMTVPQGTYFVLPQISIKPKQSMHMTISGLPSMQAWRVWGPRIAGLIAIFLMLGGLAIAIYRTSMARTTDVGRAKKRAELLDELVELEKSGTQDDKRRTQITNELEDLWVD